MKNIFVISPLGDLRTEKLLHKLEELKYKGVTPETARSKFLKVYKSRTSDSDMLQAEFLAMFDCDCYFMVDKYTNDERCLFEKEVADRCGIPQVEILY